MSLSTNKILVAGAATNTAGAYIQTVSLGNATATIPAGIYQMVATANVTIEMNTSTNLAAPSYVIALANNTSGLIISDGVNFRANVLAGTLYGTNGGLNVSSTFAS
jgi:hypothetical protein